MKGRILATAAVALAGALSLKLALSGDALAQPPAGNPSETLFQERCASCHEPAIDRAPDRASIATRSVAQLVDIMTNGPMQPMAAGLTRDQVQALAAHLGPRAPVAQAAAAGRGLAPAAGRGGAAGSGWNPALVDNMCATAAPPIQMTPTSWSNFGIDPANHRFQRNPGLTVADVPKLKVKWSFSMPGGSYGQPTVVGDWLFITSRGGTTYALDAKSGCVRWKNAEVGSRTAPMVVNRPGASPSGWVTYIPGRDRAVHMLDAATGRQIWVSDRLETHNSSSITGSPMLFGDQLFVPLTSGEEGAGGSPNYSCCSFRGSVVALDARDGKIQWKTSMIPEPLRPTRKNNIGVQLQGPAGAAIWSAPTLDTKRRLIYVATGDSYTDAPTVGADAIVAIDMATGAVKWRNQVTEHDNFIVSCTTLQRSTNCPEPSGPDFDFGSAPILFHLPSGKDVVLSGQKSGVVYGMDADTGRTLWKRQIGDGSALGGVEWGMAADDRALYAPVSDLVLLITAANKAAGRDVVEHTPPGRPGLYAINPANGALLWSAPAPRAPCTYYGDRSRDRAAGCMNSQSAAPSVMPGVVFSGTVDGWFRAYDARTGRVIWSFSTTAQTYDTLNGARGQPGGSIDGMGPAIAGGMVYTFSGFNGAANTGGNGTNVLLAFSVDGR